jgi:hypothetical protein
MVNFKRITFFVFATLAVSSPNLAQNAEEIIQRSVEATNRDFAAEPQFDCSEENRNAHGDKTYDALMIDGSLYQRLVAINGKPLPPSQEVEEAQKLQAEIEKRKKQNSEQRSQRIAKYNADRKRDHELLGEMVKAFEFSLIGQQQMEGHRVYVLQAKPRPGYRAPSKEAEALTGMNGKLWIDTETFQWVKVEASVTHPVSIGGLLARVEPGTRFELDKMPVAPGVWLAKRFSMKSQAKVLLLFQHRKWEQDTYSNYRPAPGTAYQDRKTPQQTKK